MSTTDIEAIRNTVNEFANCFDVKDWVGLRAVLSDTIACDYRALRGEVAHLSAEHYVSKRRETLSQLSTHHLLANHQIAIDGAKATCVASCMIWRRLGNKAFNTHALYYFELKHQGAAWKIYGITQKVLWCEGDASIHTGVQKNASGLS